MSESFEGRQAAAETLTSCVFHRSPLLRDLNVVKEPGQLQCLQQQETPDAKHPRQANTDVSLLKLTKLKSTVVHMSKNNLALETDSATHFKTERCECSRRLRTTVK